jgi:hypothetical protein
VKQVNVHVVILAVCLGFSPLLCKGDDDAGKVLSSVRVYQLKERVFCEVRIENATTRPIEAHRTPSSLSFSDVPGEPQTAGEAVLKSWGPMFRSDGLTIQLRPGETFIKQIDITSRVHPGTFSVFASWGPDKDIPRARQEGVVTLTKPEAPASQK